MARGLAVVLSVLAAASIFAGSGGDGALDLGLALQVVWGDESMGPESLREEVERFVLQRVEQSRCYASVRRFGPGAGGAGGSDEAPPDLHFGVTLSRLEEHERWELSVAERTAPDRDPGETQNRVEATIGFDVSMELALLPEGTSLRIRSYRHEHRYRPQRGEDPREEARRVILEDLAQEATRFVCKRAGKLPRQIERARGAGAD